MKVLDFVLWYQYFDSLESKLHNDLIDRCRLLGSTPDRIRIDVLRDVEQIKIELNIVQKIENDLKHFFLDIRPDR